MTGLYVFVGLVILAMASFIFFKIKWSRTSKEEARVREANIEKERVEQVAANRKA